MENKNKTMLPFTIFILSAFVLALISFFAKLDNAILFLKLAVLCVVIAVILFVLYYETKLEKLEQELKHLKNGETDE